MFLRSVEISEVMKMSEKGIPMVASAHHDFCIVYRCEYNGW